MTLTIEVAPEIEVRLEAEAKRNGISKDDLAKNVIEERFALKEDQRKNYMPENFIPRYIGKVETRDFSGDREWIRENRDKYQGKYVAIHGNRLIASGDRLKEVAEKARQEGFPDAFLKFIEPLDAPPYLGGVW